MEPVSPSLSLNLRKKLEDIKRRELSRLLASEDSKIDKSAGVIKGPQGLRVVKPGALKPPIITSPLSSPILYGPPNSLPGQGSERRGQQEVTYDGRLGKVLLSSHQFSAVVHGEVAYFRDTSVNKGS